MKGREGGARDLGDRPAAYRLKTSQDANPLTSSRACPEGGPTDDVSTARLVVLVISFSYTANYYRVTRFDTFLIKSHQIPRRQSAEPPVDVTNILVQRASSAAKSNFISDTIKLQTKISRRTAGFERSREPERTSKRM